MNVPYRIQQLIWPFIRDTTCYYCIFIRGTVAGVLLTAAIGGALWVKFYS